MKTTLKTCLLLALTGTAFAQSVPPPRVDGQVARPNVPSPTGTRDGQVPPAVKALDIVTDVKKGAGYGLKITDSVTGQHYKGALKGYGNLVKGADVAVEVAQGYYRDGSTGAEKEAIEAGFDLARDFAIDAGAVALVKLSKVATVAVPTAAAAAAVSASAGLGIFFGKQIDDHYRQDIGRGTDWAFDHYDRKVLEPRREEMGQALREKHQRAKAEHAAQAAAQFQVAPYSPVIAAPSGPSPIEHFLGIVTQAQQAHLQAQPALRSAPRDTGMWRCSSGAMVTHAFAKCPER